MLIADGNKNDIVNEGTVLVDFWAPWCGPCKMVAPVLEQLDEKVSELPIVKINVDEYPEIAGEFEIMSVPTLILFRDGKEEKRISGFQSVEKLIEFIK